MIKINAIFKMKKRALTFLAILVCFSAVLSARSQQPDTLRVLSVANSFGVDAVENNLYDIAKADGHVMIIGNMYIGGCSLERHYNNSISGEAAYSFRKVKADGSKEKTDKMTFEACFASEPWDIVIFHQASPLCGLPETYEPFLTKLIAYARAHTPKKSKIMINQTWAYAVDATHEKFGTYGHSQEKMYEALCDAYSKAAKKHKLELIPSGTAVQNSRGTFNQDNVTRDGYHMHPWFGRYMVACTYYESIYKTSVVGNAYEPENLSEERKELAQKCAHAACQHPLIVSKIDYETGDADWLTGHMNDDLKSIRPYTLPDALTMQDGRKVETAEQWFKERRPELLNLFDTEMFGKAPGKIEGTTWEVIDEDRHALGGKAIRKQIKIDFNRDKRYIIALMYLPADAEGKVPVFMGLNFNGNATINADPAILYPSHSHAKAYGIYHEFPRGSYASRWPVEEIIARGYGLVTFHTSDVDPDFDDGFQNGVSKFIYKEGQNYPEPDQWGTISAWAWGLSRVLDYLETDPDVDATKVAAIGHSRLGKTALLAGARDERFAMVISNSSGCGGAALSRRHYGETVKSIIRYFPHWFCANFNKYAEHEDMLPFDQHEFLALIAPRPVYVASAELDGWADPVGERISLQEAQRVYDFLGLDRGLTGYHIRQGKHDLTLEDWIHYLDFADRYLK